MDQCREAGENLRRFEVANLFISSISAGSDYWTRKRPTSSKTFRLCRIEAKPDTRFFLDMQSAKAALACCDVILFRVFLYPFVQNFQL